MINIVLFGPPGAGKGTQAAKIIEKYGLKHISTGDVFRWHISNDTQLGLQVKKLINDGKLVPDDVTIAMLKEEVEKRIDDKGILFDGFPRTTNQAAALDNLMEQMDTKIHRVIALDVPENEVRKRIAKRKNEEGRADDQEDKLNQRISEYFNKTIQVLPYYKAQNRLTTISGIGDIEHIASQLSKEIDTIS